MSTRPLPVVLYADDDSNDILLAQLAFKKAGVPVSLHIVRDGADVLDWLNDKGVCADRNLCPLPHLVITDLNMRVTSGFEVVRRIRSHPTFSTLPVIVYSTSANPDHATMSTDLGANAYCVKKASFNELLQKVKILLGLRCNSVMLEQSPVPALPTSA